MCYQIHYLMLGTLKLFAELKNAFDLQVRQHPMITLAAKTAEEKNSWLCALFSLNSWR